MAKLYFYYSAMNAGKSTTLLQSSHNYRERGMETILYTPNIDDRHNTGVIHSRIGLEANAVTFDKNFDLYGHTAEQLEQADHNIRCVLIDEAQFLCKEQVKQLGKIADELHTPVLAYGLRSDFQGEPFPGSKYLLTWAEEIIEIKTICHCGRKATMNMRIDAQGNAVTAGEQIQIGGNESYISTCRICFKRGISSSKQSSERVSVTS